MQHLKNTSKDFQIVDLFLMVKCVCSERTSSRFQSYFSQDKISLDTAKVKTVREFNHLQNVKDLRIFLGMTNCCSKFTEGDAEICHPL